VDGTSLDRSLCRIGGLNQNFATSCGTPCHVQVEDYGPVVDRSSEQEVRRVNVIVYANYGTPAARIVFGRDFDYPDVRTHEYNITIKEQMHELVAQAQAETEQMEQRELTCMRVWLAGRPDEDDATLREEFREFAELYPVVFKRVLAERRAGAKAAAAAAPSASSAPSPTVAPAPAPAAMTAPAAMPAPAPAPAAPVPARPPAAPTPAPAAAVPTTDVLYPLDAERRRRVIEIEGVITRLDQDFLRLKSYGLADDLLQQRCRKLIEHARECISSHRTGMTDIRILDLALDNLGKTWRQIRSLLQIHDRA
jgi:hypothetical protein